MNKLKWIVKRNLLNIPGWRTKRKIVVIESDDWGAIRMPSEKVLAELNKIGVKTENCHYLQNDSLASASDLVNLFDVLKSFSDCNTRSPVLTANVIMGNPDFNKIRAHNFENFYYELFTDTLKKYPEHAESFGMWKEGIKKSLFHPQYHGREHIQVLRWMKFARDTQTETAKAFNLNMYGLSTNTTTEKRRSYLAAYDFETDEERNFVLSSIEDGLKHFRKLFGYTSQSAIAPNYTWNDDVEKVLCNNDVRYLQGASVQRSPQLGKSTNNTIRHYTGQKNKFGQIYLVRNCRFEPSSNPGINWVEQCFNEIKTAFFWEKPAIIESHRVNYIGFINPENRDCNLKLLRELLTKIVKRWSDVEFMSSDHLGNVIEEDQH